MFCSWQTMTIQNFEQIKRYFFFKSLKIFNVGLYNNIKLQYSLIAYQSNIDTGSPRHHMHWVISISHPKPFI